jgi:hypothetical protein
MHASVLSKQPFKFTGILTLNKFDKGPGIFQTRGMSLKAAGKTFDLGRQLVPLLAGHLAGSAACAFVGINHFCL